MEALGLQHEARCQRAAAGFADPKSPTAAGGNPAHPTTIRALKGKALSTPSQTAWSLIGLLAMGDPTDPAVTRGVRYLLDRQQPDGSWAEDAFTGTGFPRVFYLNIISIAIAFLFTP